MPSFAYLFERYPSFVQTFCYREAEEMARQGMDPWIASIRKPQEARDLEVQLRHPVNYLPEEKALRAEVDRRRAARLVPWKAHRAIRRFRDDPDSQRIFEAAWLAPELRQRGISHVHAHFGGVAARTAWWLWRLHGIAYSFTGHANDIFCDTEHPVSNAALVRAARFVVCETDYARAWMEQRHPFARGKIYRVFNGVETSGFPPRGVGEEPPLIVSVGRYVEKKGFSDLIEAARLLARDGIAFRCEIIGGGPLEGALRSQIAAAGLEGQVLLRGALSQEEVRARLALADLFVLACVVEQGGGSDNLPTVIMEAMTSGLATVTTAVAGVREMVTDGEDGRVLPPGEPAQLAKAIAALLADRPLREQWGERARARAAATFDVRNTTRALKRLLVRHAGVCPPPAAVRHDLTLQVPLLSRIKAKLFR